MRALSTGRDAGVVLTVPSDERDLGELLPRMRAAWELLGLNAGETFNVRRCDVAEISTAAQDTAAARRPSGHADAHAAMRFAPRRYTSEQAATISRAVAGRKPLPEEPLPISGQPVPLKYQEFAARVRRALLTWRRIDLWAVTLDGVLTWWSVDDIHHRERRVDMHLRFPASLRRLACVLRGSHEDFYGSCLSCGKRLQ
jgi:hypothetical protein